jgi:hypothetical protein
LIYVVVDSEEMPSAQLQGYTCNSRRGGRASEWRGTARRTIMAKGQMRGNREAKKPKKPKVAAAPAATFLPRNPRNELPKAKH